MMKSETKMILHVPRAAVDFIEFTFHKLYKNISKGIFNTEAMKVLLLQMNPVFI